MRHLSLFTGIGGFDIGFERAGAETVGQVEWDKSCRLVLERHWPNVPRWEDVNDVHGQGFCVASSEGLSDAHIGGGTVPGPNGITVANAKPVLRSADRSDSGRVTAGRSARTERIGVREPRRPDVQPSSSDGPRSGGSGGSCDRCLPAFDVLSGGFPCQDISVAGKRAGLAGERSGLWWQFARLIDETCPAWVVIENVPGLLSSNRGRDMGAILGTLGEYGYGFAYRVLDAQWFGVAHRRRRVFIVGHLGGDGASQVLAVAEGSAGYPPPSRETGEGVAVGVVGRPDLSSQVAGTLGQRGNKSHTELDGHGAHVVPRDIVDVPLPPPSDLRWPLRVRRLTPTECARLQGFPDDWNDHLSDSQRYKQFGNAVCVNVAEWLGRRIMEVAG